MGDVPSKASSSPRSSTGGSSSSPLALSASAPPASPVRIRSRSSSSAESGRSSPQGRRRRRSGERQASTSPRLSPVIRRIISAATRSPFSHRSANFSETSSESERMAANEGESSAGAFNAGQSAAGLSEHDLRKEVKKIQQDATLESKEKSRRIQRLMTTSWRSRQPPPSCPKVSSLPPPPMIEEGSSSNGNERFGCVHYQRGCAIKVPCCGIFAMCRLCHEKDVGKDHVVERKNIKQIKCLRCGKEQPVSNKCVKCETKFARYFCKICNFFDDTPGKKIYHCPHCNICRIGEGLGIDYFHCHRCNACMAISLKDNHKCVERVLESNCPVCHEYMFTSTSPVCFLPCGHCMHSSCHKTYSQSNYVCPICSKAMADMREYYTQLDSWVAEQEMPEGYRNVVSTVFCADCEKRSTAPFHFLYHKCAHCGSYNTKVISQQTEDRSRNIED